MSRFTLRWLRNLVLLSLTILALALVQSRFPVQDWQRSALLTGWLLTAALVCLVVFNVRKKLPFLPLLSSASWLQFHAYLGILAAGILLLHTGGRFPAGAFNRVLWVFFVLLAVSGFFGLWLSRVLPHRLRSRGEVILFERIPTFRARLAEEVEALAAGSVRENGSMVIADLYVRRVKPFLAGSGPYLAHMFESRRALAGLRRDFESVERYLPKAGRDCLAAIEERVVVKDRLDYQHAIYLTLRGWLFLHIPLAYGIFPLVVIHILLFYAFGRI